MKEKRNGTSCHPVTNGLAERLVQSFKKAAKADKSTRTLQHKLDRFLIAYRSAPHATTDQSPAQLFLGRNIKTRLDLLKSDVTRGVNKKLLQSNDSALKSFEDHQNVSVRDYGPGPKWVNGIVVERMGPVLYRVKVHDQMWKRHTEQLRASNTNPSTQDVTECVIPDSIEQPAVGETPMIESPVQAEASSGAVYPSEPEES